MVAYSFKERFVWPIKIGLGTAVPDSFGAPKPKRQTIRAYGKRRHARPGEMLQLYYAQRTKQCEKIGDARCVAVDRIQLWLPALAVLVNGKILTARQIQNLARNDGFANVFDMVEFWQKAHPGVEKFEGVMIRWEPL